MGANSRSTVGTATDAYSMLRLIYSRLGEPHVGPSSLFSFNDPQGMCPRLRGAWAACRRSTSTRWSTAACRSTRARSRCRTSASDSWGWRMYAESGFFDPDKQLADYAEAEWEQFLHGPEAKVEIRGLNLKWEGLVAPLRAHLPLQGRRDRAAAHPRGDRARRDVRAVPGLRRRAAQPGRARRADRRPQHRRVRGDAGRRPRAAPRGDRRARPSRRRSTRCGTRSTASSRSASAT